MFLFWFTLQTRHLQPLHLCPGVFQSGAIARRSCLSCSPDSSLHFHSFTCQEDKEADRREVKSAVMCYVSFLGVFLQHTPLLYLNGMRPPRSIMCCLARLSLFCSTPFWLSNVATRASSSWMVSSMSLSFTPPDPGGACRRRSSLVDILMQTTGG